MVVDPPLPPLVRPARDAVVRVLDDLRLLGPRAALGRVRASDFVEHQPRHLASDTCTRVELQATDAELIVLIFWKPGQFSRAHDHGGSRCVFRVLQGVATERRFKRLDADLVALVDEDRFLPSSIVSCDGDEVHAMGNDPASAEVLITLHVYRPRPAMREYRVVQEVGHD